MEFKKDYNWVHFIGIAGVATAQLAVAMLGKGYVVSGSDENIYEPMKSYLERYKGLKVNNGYNYRNLIEGDSIPSLVIAVGGLSRKNKEILFARKYEIEVKSYPEVLQNELIVPDNSIVIAGSFGKTTTTAALIDIFKEAGKNISYMVGGQVVGWDTGLSLKTPATEFSIIEGDEYMASRDDTKSKFFYYNPKYLVITGYTHDHTDLFATEEAYFANFIKLVKTLPKDGILVLNAKFPRLVELSKYSRARVVFYKYDKDTHLPKNNLFGEFNYENLLAAITIATQLGIGNNSINSALKNFKGIKRRLEQVSVIESNDKKILVIDDFGASAGKAGSAISAMREKYPKHKIVAVFEPNLGSRTIEAIPQYKKSFAECDFLLLPQFTEIKQQGLLTSEEFARNILENNYIDKQKIVLVANNKNFAGDVKGIINNTVELNNWIVLFLSSHSVDKYLKDLHDVFKK